MRPDARRGAAIERHVATPESAWEQTPVAVLAVELTWQVAPGVEALLTKVRTSLQQAHLDADLHSPYLHCPMDARRQEQRRSSAWGCEMPSLSRPAVEVTGVSLCYARRRSHDTSRQRLSPVEDQASQDVTLDLTRRSERQVVERFDLLGELIGRDAVSEEVYDLGEGKAGPRPRNYAQTTALAEAQLRWLREEAKRRGDAQPGSTLLKSRYPLYKAEEEQLVQAWLDRVGYGETIPAAEENSS